MSFTILETCGIYSFVQNTLNNQFYLMITKNRGFDLYYLGRDEEVAKETYEGRINSD